MLNHSKICSTWLTITRTCCLIRTTLMILGNWSIARVQWALLPSLSSLLRVHAQKCWAFTFCIISYKFCDCIQWPAFLLRSDRLQVCVILPIGMRECDDFFSEVTAYKCLCWTVVVCDSLTCYLQQRRYKSCQNQVRGRSFIFYIHNEREKGGKSLQTAVEFKSDLIFLI